VCTGAEAYVLAEGQFIRLVRIWLAKRGIWGALPGRGPPSRSRDPRGRARYVNAYGELPATLR
jgi:hypothetical protein